MDLRMTYKRNGIFSLLLAFGFLAHNEAFPKGGGRSRSAARGSRGSRYGRPILVIVPHPGAVKFEGQKGIELNLTSEELTLERSDTEDEVSVSKLSSPRQFNLLSIIGFAGAGIGVVLIIRVCAGQFLAKKATKCRKNCHYLPKCQPDLREGTKGYKKICHAQTH